jgi:hypothetical protein
VGLAGWVTVAVGEGVDVAVGGIGVLVGVSLGAMVAVLVSVGCGTGDSTGILVTPGKAAGVAVAVEVGVWSTRGEGILAGKSIAPCSSWSRAQNTMTTAPNSTNSVSF